MYCCSISFGQYIHFTDFALVAGEGRDGRRRGQGGGSTTCNWAK